MHPKLHTLLIVTLITFTTHAQDPHRRRDTIPLGQWKQEIIRVPVLTGTSQPIIIVPNRQPFCFDKLIMLKLDLGSRIIQRAMYLDTRQGLSGMLPPATGTPVQEIIPDQPGFVFDVNSLKGNIYTYKTNKGRNDVLEHWVFTGNSQTYLLQAGAPGSNAAPAAAPNLPLFRKNETRPYCDNKLIGQAYRLDNGPSTWYIYGDRYPEKIHPIPNKYMGNFGVGYLMCEEGLYLVLERTMGRLTARITSMDNVNKCFDPTAFQIQDEHFQTRANADIQTEQRKLQEQAGHIDGDCVAEKTELNQYRQQVGRQKEEALRRSQRGNLYQDTAAQRAMLSLTDPLITVHDGILSEKVALCNSRAALSHATERDRLAISEKINCHSDRLTALQTAESKMQDLDRQYATNPARANAEKSRLYLAVTRNLPSCD
ncbi:MAG: hypothetical protein JST68_23970 [Bacteroidetes bacterium]|nr:hypothetical protein [Bacteroidota bacterium]